MGSHYLVYSFTYWSAHVITIHQFSSFHVHFLFCVYVTRVFLDSLIGCHVSFSLYNLLYLFMFLVIFLPLFLLRFLSSKLHTLTQPSVYWASCFGSFTKVPMLSVFHRMYSIQSGEIYTVFSLPRFTRFTDGPSDFTCLNEWSQFN